MPDDVDPHFDSIPELFGNPRTSGIKCPDFSVQLLRPGRAQDRIRESIAVIDAISTGELQSALPADPAAQRRHQTAVSLLGAIEVLLNNALLELQETDIFS